MRRKNGGPAGDFQRLLRQKTDVSPDDGSTTRRAVWNSWNLLDVASTCTGRRQAKTGRRLWHVNFAMRTMAIARAAFKNISCYSKPGFVV